MEGVAEEMVMGTGDRGWMWGLKKKRVPQALAEIQRRELKIGEIMSFLRQPVTSPWESRATGEPDFARRRRRRGDARSRSRFEQLNR